MLNKHGIEVRKNRNEEKNAKGSYYHCDNCNYDNTDIQDIAKEVCWKCGGKKLSRKRFVN